MAAVALVALIPITPGAVGVSEVAYIGFLSAVGGSELTGQIAGGDRHLPGDAVARTHPDRLDPSSSSCGAATGGTSANRLRPSKARPQTADLPAKS